MARNFEMDTMESSEVFATKDVTEIFKNRFIVVIGDSIQRGIYKDLVLILQSNRYLAHEELRSKGDFTFLGDELVEGGKKSQMTNGISYKEVRQYQTDVHLVRFYFMTRCYNSYLESILKDLKEGPSPDVVIMNSCLWDITRYGLNSINEYKENLQTLFTRFLQCLPAECLVIWTTTLPISNSARGGFLVPEIEFMSTTLRLDILESNFFAKQLAADHGFDVLDLHFYLRHYLHCRVKDGIHWDMLAHRYITNLLLTHICDAWNIAMPTRAPATLRSYGSVARVQKGNLKWGAPLLPRPNLNNISNTFHGSQNNFQNEQNPWFYGAKDCENQSNWSTTSSLGNWNGSSPACNGDFWNRRMYSDMAMNLINTMDLCNQVFTRSQNLQWETYQQNPCQSLAPSRRKLRQHHNPYRLKRF